MKQYSHKKVLLLMLAMCGMLCTSGLLLAQGKDGDVVTKERLAEYDFWETLWGEEIANSPTGGKGKPWYKEDGLPIQREGQKTFAAVKSDDGAYTIVNDEDFLDMIGADADEGFSVGDGGAPDSFSMELSQDIDLDGATIDPIKTFKGVLEGNGYAIKNFTVDGRAFIENLTGTVQNLVLENVTVTYDGDSAAILASTMDDGTITNCLIKDCHLTGKRYLGMFAGNMVANSNASIQKCLVVNGSITSLANDDGDTSAVYVGGIVGNIGFGNTCENCVSMLDMFNVHYKPAKAGSFGRVYGALVISSDVANNYGWVETGFALWDDDKESYYRKYFPYWGTSAYYQTGEVSTTDKHGQNLFVGDTYTSSTYYSTDESFWSSTVGFTSANDWEFNSGDEYPKPSGNNNLSTTALKPRRGYEMDMSAFSASGVNNVHTSQMFYKMSGTSTVTGTVNMYTDIEFATRNEISSETAPLWGFCTSNSASNSINNPYYIKTMSGELYGNGHEITGISYTRTSTSYLGTPYYGFIGRIDGTVNRLALTDIYFYVNQSSSASLFLGGVAGISSSSEITNCYVDINTLYLQNNEENIMVGGITGNANSMATLGISQNIVKFSAITAYLSGSEKKAIVAGLVGYNSNSILEKNTIMGYNTGTGASSITGNVIYGTSYGGDIHAYVGTVGSNYRISTPYRIHVSANNTKNLAEIATLDSDLWGSTKMDLDTTIWVIPADGEIAYLIKEWYDWE